MEMSKYSALPRRVPDQNSRDVNPIDSKRQVATLERWHDASMIADPDCLDVALNDLGKRELEAMIATIKDKPRGSGAVVGAESVTACGGRNPGRRGRGRGERAWRVRGLLPGRQQASWRRWL